MSSEEKLDLTKCRSPEEIYEEYKAAAALHDDIIDLVSWMDGCVMSGYLWGLYYALGIADAKASSEFKAKIDKRLEDMKSYNEDVA